MPIFAAPQLSYPHDAETWERETKPAILRSFTAEIYGRPVDTEVQLSWKLLRERELPHGTRRQIALTMRGPFGTTILVLLVHLPHGTTDTPAFLGLNFRGNHTTTTDPDVIEPGGTPAAQAGTLDYEGLREQFSIPPPRGSKAGRWPVDAILRRGYAVVTASYLQCGPDHPDLFDRGVHPMLERSGALDRQRNRWGGIGIWAWTLSRVLDAVVAGAVPEIDPTRVTVMGHSRLGKTALWAAARDERFAAAISNNSGAMGAALSRDVGETPEVLARIRPYWFARAFSERVLRGDPLPVDQHQLMACIAPRPVYVASASEDLNADPEGEFLSWQRASTAWSLYGYPRLDGTFPAPGECLSPPAPLGYHLRAGGHDVEPYDWDRWLDFTDRWVVGRT